MMSVKIKTSLQKLVILAMFFVLGLTASSQEHSGHIPKVNEVDEVKGKITLSWGAGENINYYVVQRSNDGVNYSNVALVFGHIVDGQPKICMFKDRIKTGRIKDVSYRVQQVDLNKTVNESQVSANHHEP